MRSKLTLCALTAPFLWGCATPLPAPQPSQISPSLTVHCPPHLQRALITWGDLATDYSELLAEHQDCRARHKALSDATKKGTP